MAQRFSKAASASAAMAAISDPAELNCKQFAHTSATSAATVPATKAHTSQHLNFEVLAEQSKMKLSPDFTRESPCFSLWKQPIPHVGGPQKVPERSALSDKHTTLLWSTGQLCALFWDQVIV